MTHKKLSDPSFLVKVLALVFKVGEQMINPVAGVYNLSHKTMVPGVLESLYATLSHYYATKHNGQFCYVIS